MRKPIQKINGLMISVGIISLLMAALFAHPNETEKEMTVIEPSHMEQISDREAEFGFAWEEQHQDIVFFSNHQYVQVFADGEKVYSLEEDGGVWGHTTGSVWNFVRVPEGTNQLQVRMTAAYDEVKDLHYNFYISDEMHAYRTILRSSMPTAIVCAFIVFVGMFMVAYWMIVNRKSYIGKSLFYLGEFSILLGLWSINETNCASIMIENRIASSFASFILLSLIPIPFILFIKEFIRSNDRKIWKILCGLSALQFAAMLILHFTQILEMRESVFLIHLVMCFAILYVFGVLIYKAHHGQIDRRFRANIIGIVILAAATVSDFIWFYLGTTDADLIGRIGFLVFVVILGKEAAMYSLGMIEKGRKASIYEELATTDILTGLLNRNAYMSDIGKLTANAEAMIVTFDLNNLKICNDTRGHKAGDHYLVKASQLIEKVFARYGQCYRIGGDEFCAVIRNASRCPIDMLIRNLEKESEKYNSTRQRFPVYIACGYAIYDKKLDADFEGTRDRADRSMYAHKHAIKAFLEGEG